MSRADRFLRWCKRYFSFTLLLVIVVLAIVLFVNDNSVMRNYEYQQEITRLRQEIKATTDSLEHYQALNRELETDRETTERIVREEYHMQHPNEDVYVFE